MGVKGWTQHTDKRGVRLTTGLVSDGLTIGDLRSFLIEADKVGMSETAVVQFTPSSLSESGRRSYELGTQEDYEPDPDARPERASRWRYVRPYGITSGGVMTYAEES